MLYVPDAMNLSNIDYVLSVGNEYANAYAYTKTIYFSNSGELKVSLAWLKNIQHTTEGDYNSMDLTNYDLRVYGPNGFYYSSSSLTNNIEYLDIDIPQSGYYTIKVYQNGDQGSTYDDKLAITFIKSVDVSPCT